MSKVNSISHILFRYLIHFPFYHGNKLLRGSDHDIHIGFCQLLCTWVDDELPIDTPYAYLGDRSIERDVRYRQASRGSESRQGIRHHVLIMRHKLNHHLYFAVVFLREERSQYPIHQAHCKDFLITRACFTLEETTGEAPSSSKFFTIIYSQRKEIHTFTCFLISNDCGQEHGIAHLYHYGTIGLLGQFSCFNGDCTSIGKSNYLFFYFWNHKSFY